MIWQSFVLAAYAWPHDDHAVALAERISPPPGYVRIATRSFGTWLRALPTLPGQPPLKLYSGADKANQSAHHTVIDIDVGAKDLQQCADAVIRLRAEYLWDQRLLEKKQRALDIAFHYTNGQLKRVPTANYGVFRTGLDDIFMYAGTRSLEKELTPARDVQLGDVFIHGGSPGHAMLVVDVAEHAQSHERIFLLLQSYMPAQQMHVVINPNDAELSPWYRLADPLKTAEWTFRALELRRFPAE